MKKIGIISFLFVGVLGSGCPSETPGGETENAYRQLPLTAATMKNKDVFYYSETDDACSVRMLYGNGNFAMYLLLPKEGYGQEDSMKPETVNTVVDNKELYEVDLRVPSFNHSYKCDLVGSLENLGMKKVFEGVVENDVYTLNMMLHEKELLCPHIFLVYEDIIPRSVY